MTDLMRVAEDDPTGPSVWKAAVSCMLPLTILYQTHDVPVANQLAEQENCPQEGAHVPADAWEYMVRKANNDAAFQTLDFKSHCSHIPGESPG